MASEYFVSKRQNLAIIYLIAGSILGSLAAQIIWPCLTQYVPVSAILDRIGLWVVAVIVTLSILQVLRREPTYMVLSPYGFGLKGVGTFTWDEVTRITSRAHPQTKRWGRVPHWSSTYEFELKDGRICEVDLDKFADKDKDAVANAISVYAVTYNGIPVHLV